MVLLGNKENFYFGASEEIIKRARILRKTMTKAEETLWNHLRKKQFEGLRFRRQHPIGRFIVDFYCHALKLVIEVDGNIHQEDLQKERDENRTYELQKLGLTVLRFDNEMVLKDIPKVLKDIEEYIG